jgi:hypothetical protein
MELVPSTLLGLCLTMAGLLLYFVKIRKKYISRDYDLFFSSVGFLCGGILIFQGWRLDPILLLCQMMSGVTAIFFIVETLWLRNFHIENPQRDCGLYQNLLNANQINLTKKIIFSKNNMDLNQSKQISKDTNLSNLINNLLTINYTYPIDYY